MDGRVSGANNPLVGRRDVVARFEGLLDAAVNGEFRFAGLSGEPGAGKTRLLAELAAEAERRGLLTLWGRAAEFEQEMPFGAMVDALDDHLETVSKDLPARLGAQTARTLAGVFSSLVPDEPGADAPGTAPGRYALYRAVRRLMEELTAPNGLVLILDDLHWADESSVELLDHLVRHAPRGQLLITVAYRPAQASPG